MSLNYKPYSGLTFLLTKPEQQAKNLCTSLESLGGRCLLFPTLAIEVFPPAKIAPIIAKLPPTEKVIFTSSNAVSPVMPYWEKFKNVSVTFAVGSGTAKTLANFHIIAKLPAKFTSEGLLELPELQVVKNQHITIFSGVGGRDLLPKELKKRGAVVEKVAVYRRSCPMVAAEFPPLSAISLIISTSEESLVNLWQLMGVSQQAWLKEQHLLVVSPKMQVLAQRLGFKHQPILADNATDAAILKACEPK
jgi:uroporphyrinogen-III synthase